MNKEKIFDELAKIKSFTDFSPVVGEKGLVPIQPNFRLVLSHPEAVRLIVEALAEKAGELDFDLIAGGEDTGIALGSELAAILKKPFIYVRKVKSEGGEIELVEGDYEAGQKILLVDDIMITGDTKIIFANNLLEKDLKVVGILVIMSNASEESLGNQKRLKKAKINVSYLFDLREIVEAMKKRGFISDEIYPYYLEYIENPEKWQKNKAGWQEYCQIAKHKLNLPMPEELEDLFKMK